MGDKNSALWATLIGGTMPGKVVSQFQAADARKQALELQAKQMELTTLQKTVANYDQVQKVLDAQTAMATVQGFSLGSSSFNAIQRDTANIGAKYFKKIKTEGQLAQNAIKIEKENVNRTLYSQLFGDVTELATAAFQINSKLPTLE